MGFIIWKLKKNHKKALPDTLVLCRSCCLTPENAYSMFTNRNMSNIFFTLWYSHIVLFCYHMFLARRAAVPSEPSADSAECISVPVSLSSRISLVFSHFVQDSQICVCFYVSLELNINNLQNSSVKNNVKSWLEMYVDSKHIAMPLLWWSTVGEYVRSKHLHAKIFWSISSDIWL